MKRIFQVLAVCAITPAMAQKTYQTLQVPGRHQFCQIDTGGRRVVLPSGRLVTPAGNGYALPTILSDWPLPPTAGMQ
ncbi:hypothetical protein [Arsenicibacter rosenii]|uniref:Uncharacterized protein n=1 Tax=Arsenicibacter rosenii TaxID=1750698 RepID=A0A1S2VK86_9BACT|nr:hypothetical protein [Arsenicibacter rosenii]OIN59143.1 hypothetical protein BLX24_09085 [Arsenicibacter rosenii]